MLRPSTTYTLDKLAQATTVDDLKLVLQNLMLMILTLEGKLIDQGSLKR